MLDNWNSLELDFHEVYHTDVEAVLEQRSWRWFKLRALSLAINPNTRIHAALTKEEPNGADDD